MQNVTSQLFTLSGKLFDPLYVGGGKKRTYEIAFKKHDSIML